MPKGAFVLLTLLLCWATTAPQGGRLASAQDAGPLPLVQEFFADVARKDVAAAAALFSDDADYTAANDCQSGCSAKSDIERSIELNQVPFLPDNYQIAQVCGDTVIVLGQNTTASGDHYMLSIFRASGGRLTAHIRDPRGQVSMAEGRATAAEICSGPKPLTLPSTAGSGQDRDNAIVTTRFFDSINHGDSARAVSLMADNAMYKGSARGKCPGGCTGRPAIQTAIAAEWRQFAPYDVKIEQICGDTLAVSTKSLIPALAGAGPNDLAWHLAVLHVRDGQILVFEDRTGVDPLTQSGAEAAAAQVCGVRVVTPPGPLNHGGLVALETHLTLLFGAILAAVVAAVLIAAVVALARRPGSQG